MANLILTAATPAQTFSEPFTVDEVEHFLRLPALSPEDPDRTVLLEQMICSAREYSELYQGRDLVRKQWDLSLDAFSDTIELRDPLYAVDLIQYKESDGTTTTLIENTDFIVDKSKQPGIVMPPYGESWPGFTAWPSSPILIRFTSGYSSTDIFWSDSGQRILLGMKFLISRWYNNQDPILPPGSSGVEIPHGIQSLLASGALPRAR